MHMTYYKTEPSINPNKFNNLKIFQKANNQETKNNPENLSEVQNDERIDK